ncbi:MAG: hypothetical protein KGJ02_04760 [Verrucomicrobiota bacterium]|nr:hypothetical protein [Verrucomicrobiota bacterium]
MRYLFLFLSFHLSALITPTYFPLTNDPIDIVIPCAPKDVSTLNRCIHSIRKYGQHINRIIVLSSTFLTPNAEWFDEAKFPFSKADLALEIFHGDADAANAFLTTPKSRIGWIYQQFLKLYASFVIPDISPNVLVLDADVIFLKPISFMTETGEPLFTPSREYYQPYFEHAESLLPGLHRVNEQYSGIAHHMLFQKPILEDLFKQISFTHQTEPWKAICRAVDLDKVRFACMSEYEIYFNFALLRTPQAHIRELKWANITSLKERKKYQKKGYTYVAYHEWSRID